MTSKNRVIKQSKDYTLFCSNLLFCKLATPVVKICIFDEFSKQNILIYKPYQKLNYLVAQHPLQLAQLRGKRFPKRQENKNILNLPS